GHPEPDTKSPLREFDLQGGGMIATAMVACARLRLPARYVGKFGDDYWARLGRRPVARDRGDVRHPPRAPGSGRPRRQPGGRAATRPAPAAGPPAYGIRPEDLDRAVMTSGRLLHVDGVDPEAAEMAVRWAREAGIRVTMDGERAVDGVDAVWPGVDLLVCNP